MSCRLGKKGEKTGMMKKFITIFFFFFFLRIEGNQDVQVQVHSCLHTHTHTYRSFLLYGIVWNETYNSNPFSQHNQHTGC